MTRLSLYLQAELLIASKKRTKLEKLQSDVTPEEGSATKKKHRKEVCKRKNCTCNTI
jgi:hypothetical protein